MGGFFILLACFAIFGLIEYLDRRDDKDDEKFWSDEDQVP